MAINNNARKVYKTMRGKVVDMELLQQRNELTPAVGNARVNARGDQLGPGGKIIRKKEEMIKDYYEKSNRVPDELVTRQKSEPVKEEVPKAGVKVNKTTRAQQKAEASAPSARELEELEGDDWVEDENGNFVPKGE